LQSGIEEANRFLGVEVASIDRKKAAPPEKSSTRCVYPWRSPVRQAPPQKKRNFSLAFRKTLRYKNLTHQAGGQAYLA
jgi:hypothetical protein